MKQFSESANPSITFVLGGLNSGGAERVASHLIQFWYQKGIEVKVITRRGKEHDFYPIPGDLKRIIIGGEGPSSNRFIALFKNLPYIFKLRRAIKKTDTEVVLSFLTKTNIHTILACWGLDKHVVISERNDTTRQTFKQPWPILRKILYKYADVVTANSNISIVDMKNYVSTDKLSLVQNPVVLPDEKSKPEKSTNVLTVGRLVSQKRQDLLIEAFSALPGNLIDNWKLQILGDGDQRESLQNLIEHVGLEDKITLEGLVNNPSTYYLNSAIFVLTSEFEGTPNALLEAMAFGLPSIISDNLTEAKNYVTEGRNGLIFKHNDLEDLKNKISYLMTHNMERARFGRESLKIIRSYSIENVAKKWESLLRIK